MELNVEQLKDMVAAGQWAALESAWMQAAEEDLGVEPLTALLEQVVAAGQLDLAETLGWTLLEVRGQKLPAEGQLGVAKAVSSAVADSDELRSRAAGLYEQLHGRHEHFKAILQASGLLSGQPPARAFRVLEMCLTLAPGAYLANRFDNQVLRLARYDSLMGEYELAERTGRCVRVEPRTLAYEYDGIADNDFRVLCQHRPEQLSQVLQADPAAVLIGICMSHSGRVNSLELQDVLVPRHLSKDDWSGWWSRARTAAKRSPQLAIEGRNPVIITYHPGGRTLEEEMAGVIEQARMPLEHLAALTQYVREARARKLEIDRDFAGRIVRTLAQQAADFRRTRPSDALAAALALEAAQVLGVGAEGVEHPSPPQVLESADQPSLAVAAQAGTPVWAAALEALSARPDANRQLTLLLGQAPSSELDDVIAALRRSRQEEALSAAVADALAEPLEHLELFLWLWESSAPKPAGTPSKTEMLGRMLNAWQDLERQYDPDPQLLRRVRVRLRQAIGHRELACFREALAEMDEAVAGTVKRRVETSFLITDAQRHDMLALLKESFYSLFARAKLAPWADERIIWTTQAALDKRHQEYRHLVDVKMLENSRAIGAAAAHGDLRENSEWKSAIEERDLLHARAAKMQDELALAQVIRAENVPTDSVGVGSRVRLRREGEAEVLFNFLGPWEADIDKGLYNYQSALAQEMMGKTLGDKVSLRLEGHEGEYSIAELGSAL